MFQQCPIYIRIFGSVFSVPILCGTVADTSSRPSVNKNRCNDYINEGSGRQRH